MKQFLLGLLILGASSLSAQTTPEAFNLTPAVTTLVLTSTNTAAGTTLKLHEGKRNVRMYLTANGIAATTNGSLIVKFSTASGSGTTTNSFDTASLSNIKLTMSTLAGATNTVSDVFDLTGARYIRVGQIENTFQGIVSNITISVGYPTDNR